MWFKKKFEWPESKQLVSIITDAELMEHDIIIVFKDGDVSQLKLKDYVYPSEDTFDLGSKELYEEIDLSLTYEYKNRYLAKATQEWRSKPYTNDMLNLEAQSIQTCMGYVPDSSWNPVIILTLDDKVKNPHANIKVIKKSEIRSIKLASKPFKKVKLKQYKVE